MTVTEHKFVVVLWWSAKLQNGCFQHAFLVNFYQEFFFFISFNFLSRALVFLYIQRSLFLVSVFCIHDVTEPQFITVPFFRSTSFGETSLLSTVLRQLPQELFRQTSTIRPSNWRTEIKNHFLTINYPFVLFPSDIVHCIVTHLAVKFHVTVIYCRRYFFRIEIYTFVGKL